MYILLCNDALNKEVNLAMFLPRERQELIDFIAEQSLFHNWSFVLMDSSESDPVLSNPIRINNPKDIGFRILSGTITDIEIDVPNRDISNIHREAFEKMEALEHCKRFDYMEDSISADPNKILKTLYQHVPESAERIMDLILGLSKPIEDGDD